MAIVHNGCLISLPDPMYHRRSSSLTWSKDAFGPVDRKTTRQLHYESNDAVEKASDLTRLNAVLLRAAI